MRKLKNKMNNNFKKSDMKYIFLTVLFTVFTTVGWSQNFSKLETIPLKDSVDCKNAEPKVLECCNYLLSNQCVEDKNSFSAFQFVFKWATGTKNYKFKIDNLFTSVAESDKELSRRFLASMIKTAIVEKPETIDDEFTVKYLTTFVEYCENPKSKVPKSSFIKKMIKAKNDNKLDDFIREQSK